MIAVILKSNSQMVAMMTIWNSAAELKPVLERINGFISVELFQSLTKPKKILSLSILPGIAERREKVEIAFLVNIACGL